VITSPTLVVFVLASYALALVPGPAVIYIVNRSLAQGPRAGVVSALGIATGGLVHVAAAALGMSALLASSAVAFSIVKYAGAAYLVYLGIRALRNGDLPLDEAVPMLGARRVFGQGVVVNVLNPKTALFFLSFFPQFVHPERGSVPLQMALLGVVFITAAFSSDLVYALSAAGLRRIVLRSPRVRRSHRYVSASIFLGLGVAAATAE
jgi:threonine/homoserine/homoserine lactone efflux protein